MLRQFSASEESSGFAAAMRQRTKYKVIRHYFRGGRRVINTGLTLERAQEHCNDPETSSSTAKKAVGRARTRRLGPSRY